MPPKFAGKNDEDIHVQSPIILSNCSSPRSQMPLSLGDFNKEASLQRPWTELPPDITMDILHRLGAVEILETAQKVCTTWYDVCKDPAMWQVIDMRNDGDLSGRRNYLEEMCCNAVDRSQGQLVDISLEYFASSALLDYIAGRSGNLRRLRLFSCYHIYNGGLTEALKSFPKLESLNVSFTDFSNELIETVGRSSPLLCLFALDKKPYSVSYDEDEEAFAIARSMPELRHLKLLGNGLTNEGLTAILDGCPHLESLDLRRCVHVKLTRDLEQRCSTQIKCLRYPDESISEFSDVDESEFYNVDKSESSDGFLDRSFDRDDYENDYETDNDWDFDRYDLRLF